MDSSEDSAAALLAAAWRVVQQANLPQHVQGTGLEVAASLLSGRVPVEAPPKPIKQIRFTPAPASPDADEATPDLDDAPVVDALAASEDEQFATLARESGRDEDDLRRVFMFKDGELRIGVARSALGDTEAAKNRSIATLLLGARYYVEGKKDVGIGEVRAAAKALRHEPSRNLTTHLSSVPGTVATGLGNDKSVRVQESRFKAAFDAAVDSVIGGI